MESLFLFEESINMSKRVKCSIFSLLLIVGLTLVLYQPFISYFVAPKAMKGVQSIYDDLSYLQLESNLEQLKEREQDLFDFSDVKSIDASETLPSNLILDKKYVYVYQAVYKEVIMPDRTEVVEDKEGKNELSLLSCYSSDGSDRIVVQRDLIEKVLIDELNEEVKRELLNM